MQAKKIKLKFIHSILDRIFYSTPHSFISLANESTEMKKKTQRKMNRK